MRAVGVALVVLMGCGRQNFNENRDGGGDDDDGALSTDNNVAFVTSTRHDPSTFGADLAAADAICTDAAMQGHLPAATYVAYLATSTRPANTRLAGSRGWVRTDGSPFVDRTDDIEIRAVLHPLSMDENGEPVLAGPVVTGTDETGDSAQQNCSDFTDPSAMYQSGSLGSVAGGWISDLPESCAVPGHLYCFGLGKTAPLHYTRATGRLAFVSVQERTGNIGGVAGGDAVCGGEATSIGAAGAFKAMLDTTAMTAADRYSLEGEPWVRVDGIQLANTPLDFFAGNLTAALNQTAAGNYVQGAVWTGGSPSQPAGGACGDWTDSLIGSAGLYGRAEVIGPRSSDQDGASCNMSARVYCLQQ